jgi:hypothetical protein
MGEDPGSDQSELFGSGDENAQCGIAAGFGRGKRRHHPAPVISSTGRVPPKLPLSRQETGGQSQCPARNQPGGVQGGVQACDGQHRERGSSENNDPDRD